MDFRTLLKLLSIEGPSTTLTSSTFSAYLLKMISRPASKEPSYDKLLSKKRISSDLDRLYKMGLVSRRRVKRKVIIKNGSVVARGFEYQYKISKQGWQYLGFLSRPKNTQVSFSDEVQDASRRLIIDDLHNRLPETVADYLAGALSDKPFEDRGRHQRFPRAEQNKLISELQACREKLARKEVQIEMLKKDYCCRN